MASKPSITITLSPVQVDEIIRAASRARAPSLTTQISELLAAPLANGNGAEEETAPVPESTQEQGGRARFGGYIPSDTEDPRLSRSLLRGLSMLTCFGPRGEERGIVEIAGDLGMSPSTAHRYALTLVELGLLERCPTTRKYRLAGM